MVEHLLKGGLPNVIERRHLFDHTIEDCDNVDEGVAAEEAQTKPQSKVRPEMQDLLGPGPEPAPGNASGSSSTTEKVILGMNCLQKDEVKISYRAPPLQQPFHHPSASSRDEGILAGMSAENHYHVLAVTPVATPDEIKQAYRALARLHHPDKATDPVERRERMRHMAALNTAYQVLTSPRQRRAYDVSLEADPKSAAAREAAEQAATAARMAPVKPPDKDPTADFDFDFTGSGRPFRYARGKATRVYGGKEAAKALRAGLRGETTLAYVLRGDYVRHGSSTSPIPGLGESGGSNRVALPQVRARFRDFVVKRVRQMAKMQHPPWPEDGLVYASLGSGQLLLDLEILERLRWHGIRLRKVCLLDQDYWEPAVDSQKALREFADWQRLAAQMSKVEPADIYVFSSLADLCKEASPDEGHVRGCHVMLNCDAFWQGVDEDVERLIAATLQPGGLFASLTNWAKDQSPSENNNYTTLAWHVARGEPSPYLEPIVEGSIGETPQRTLRCQQSGPFHADVQAQEQRDRDAEAAAEAMEEAELAAQEDAETKRWNATIMAKRAEAKARQVAEQKAAEQARRQREAEADRKAQQAAEAKVTLNFSLPGRPFRQTIGKASRVGSDQEGLSRLRRKLRSEAVEGLDFQNVRGAVRLTGTSAINNLGESLTQGACRLERPQVRRALHDTVQRLVEEAKSTKSCWWGDDGVHIVSLGSGELLFDLELLESIRSCGVRVSKVCLIDQLYRRPSLHIRRTLQEFADCMCALADLDKAPPAEILIFGYVTDFYEASWPGRPAAGAHIFIHCDAHWEGAIADSEELAYRCLSNRGLLLRLSNFVGTQDPTDPIGQPRRPADREGPFWADCFGFEDEEVSDDQVSAGEEDDRGRKRSVKSRGALQSKLNAEAVAAKLARLDAEAPKYDESLPFSLAAWRLQVPSTGRPPLFEPLKVDF